MSKPKKHTAFTGVGSYVDGQGKRAGYLTSREGDFTVFHPLVDPAPARKKKRRA